VADDLFRKRFLFVAGKGGVGRSTVSCALALAAAREGRRVLLAGAPGKDRLGALLGLGEPLGTEHVRVAPGLEAVHMEPEAAMSEIGHQVLRSGIVYRAVFENPVVASFLRGTPGIDAWAVLGKVAWHATDHVTSDGRPAYDLVIVDGPATGHALDMLRVPRVIQDAAPPGMLRRDAERGWRLITDSTRAGVVLVTLPEDMPVDEAIELHQALGELGIAVTRLVVNRVLARVVPPDARPAFHALPGTLSPGEPLRPLADAAHRRVVREEAQQLALGRLRDALPSLPWTELPHLFVPRFDRSAVDALAAAW